MKSEKLSEVQGSIPTPRNRNSDARKVARELGQKSYFTGNPCPKGHLSTRATANGSCDECHVEKRRRAYWSDPEKHRENRRKAAADNPVKAKESRLRSYYKDVEKARKRSVDSNRKNKELYAGFVSTEPKVCAKCGTTKPASEFGKDTYKKTGLKSNCKICNSSDFKKWARTDGYYKRLIKAKVLRLKLRLENPKLRWCRVAKNSATARSKPRNENHDITVDWLYERAPDTCPLLGIVLKYDNTGMWDDSPALDRIDNNKGYSKENCWIISTKANRMKTNATVEELEMLVRNFRPALENRVMLDKSLLSTVTVSKQMTEQKDIEEKQLARGPRVNPYAA